MVEFIIYNLTWIAVTTGLAVVIWSIKSTNKAFKDMEENRLYREGQTYCTLFNDCKFGKKCKHALTPRVIARVRLWSGTDDGENLPVNTYAEEPDCFQLKRSRVTNNR